MYRLTVLRQNLPGAHSPSVDLEVGGESLKAYPIHRTRQHGRYFRLPHCVSLFKPAFERLLQMYRNAFVRSFGGRRALDEAVIGPWSLMPSLAP